MALVPNYLNYTGSLLLARNVPGANRIMVQFDHGQCLMSLVSPPRPQVPTPHGTKLPPPFRHTDLLILATVAQASANAINFPEDMSIQLPFDITDGISHYRA